MKVTNIERIPNQRDSGRWTTSQATRVYVTLTGESAAENLMQRRNRPYTEFRKLLQPRLEEMGIPVGAKLAWSQRAGCSCPCSPGFFVRMKDGYGGSYNARLMERAQSYNVYVTVEV